jgi:hypothetical protein
MHKYASAKFAFEKIMVDMEQFNIMAQVHNNNELLKWCKINRYMLEHKHSYNLKHGGPKPPPETHLFLNGGRACIPDDANAEFLNIMAQSILRDGAWVYVVEKKTDPGRMFLELDLVLWDRHLTTQDVLKEIMPPFSRVMHRAFPDQNVFAVICTAEPSIVGGDEREEV